MSRLSRRGAPAVLLLMVLLGTLAATPVLAADSDGDGLRDGFEARWGVTSPTSADSDGDGVIDAAEDSDGDRLSDLGEQRFRSDPGARDSDGDGRPDGREDHDRDGRSNAREQDQRPLPAGLRPSLARAAADVPGERESCQTGAGSSEPLACEFGVAESATTVVLLGDSHAMMYLPALRPVVAERGWRLVTLVKSACPPVLGIRSIDQQRLDEGRSCLEWQRNVFARLQADPPDVIVVAHSDSYKIVDEAGQVVPTRQRPTTWKTGMRRTLAALPWTSRVLVLGDVPDNRGNPVICLRKHKGDISACTAPRESRGQRTVEAALRQAAVKMGAQFRTLYGKICTYDPCPLVQGEVLMWRDGGHLTATFATRLIPAWRELLGSAVASAPRSSARR